jgi:hypothetical protein
MFGFTTLKAGWRKSCPLIPARAGTQLASER